MNGPLDLTGLKEALRAQVIRVDGLEFVATKPGGAPGWARDNRTRPVAYGEIHVPQWEPKEKGTGTQFFQVYTLELKLWLPYRFENPSTTEVWEDLLKRLVAHLVGNRTLGKKVSDLSLPAGANGWETFKDEQNGEILCHHAVLTAKAETWQTYTTE